MQYMYMKRPEEGVRLPGAGVIRGCELPSMCAGNLIQVLCKTVESSLRPPRTF